MITARDIQDYPAGRVEEILRGRVAGVHVFTAPGGGISVQIRGRSSILGSNEPLYVLDGMPLSPNPNGGLMINPYDIESIEVLKDAAATALYGVRGANGVIVIKTKRGN